MVDGGWQHCGKEDVDGRPCPGIRADHVLKPVQRTQRLRLCLAHLGPGQLNEVLSQLSPGCEIDLRGTRISSELLRRILTAVLSTLRDANFTAAQFDGDADFGNTVFHGVTRFRGARFHQQAYFDRARFDGDVVDLGEARFERAASFRAALFDSAADFSAAEFRSDATFTRARFSGDLDFRGAQFSSRTAASARADFTDAEVLAAVDFEGAWCNNRGGLDFSGTSFATADRLGPLGADRLLLDRARFDSAVRIEALATEVSCSQARFESGVTLRLRYARVRLDGAVLAAASSLTGSETGKEPSLDSLADPGRLALDNTELANRVRDDTSRSDRWMPVLTSVQGVDVTELSISDVDLSQTRFSGAHHLDRLVVEGRSRFAEAPRPRRRVRSAWPPVWRWTRRQLLAEEATWRATQRSRRGSDWDGLAHDTSQAATPEALAAMYRSLRKAQEDNKNGPGASDFYYGEMEMRRHASATSFGERTVLSLYWLISGYGLRALRALGCLLVIAALVAVAMDNFGFVDPHVAFGTSVLYVMEAAVSIQARSTGSDVLTWQGELLWILMRLVGPLLFGLMLLSVRNRVKR